MRASGAGQEAPGVSWLRDRVCITGVGETEYSKDSGVSDLVRNWGAFHDTGLDLHLRRRGVDTLVITGIATNMGVESTAREGYERDYRLVFAEDAITSLGVEQHEFALRSIFSSDRTGAQHIRDRRRAGHRVLSLHFGGTGGHLLGRPT